MTNSEIQIVSDESGQPTAVIVPIEMWREIESERETDYLLKSENMKRRLLAARASNESIPFEAALEKLGILKPGPSKIWHGGLSTTARRLSGLCD